jgi:hypothetical protein
VQHICNRHSIKRERKRESATLIDTQEGGRERERERERKRERERERDT